MAYDKKEVFTIILDINDLYFSYGNKSILNGLSLNVGEGELCAILGENGSGKSTLLKLIAGLIKEQRGTITISGTDTKTLNYKARARIVSYLPQRFGVYFDTDVIDVVLMGINPELGLTRAPTKEHRKMAMDALSYMKIAHLAYMNFLELSEGQKQMVMFARSVMQKAPLLLFDEPDSALDINNRRHIMESLTSLIHNTDKGALMILHDQQLALSYCDKIYLTKDGIIQGTIDRRTATTRSVSEQLNKTFENIRVFGIENEFFIGYSKGEC